jgi:hypothetical protein
MTIGTALALLITVVVIGLLLSLLRPRRPSLVNRGRRRGGYRRRRMDAMKRAAAADIALIRGTTGPSGRTRPETGKAGFRPAGPRKND